MILRGKEEMCSEKWQLMQQQQVHLPCPGRRGTVTLYRIFSLGISGSTKERWWGSITVTRSSSTSINTSDHEHQGQRHGKNHPKMHWKRICFALVKYETVFKCKGPILKPKPDPLSSADAQPHKSHRWSGFSFGVQQLKREKGKPSLIKNSLDEHVIHCPCCFLI